MANTVCQSVKNAFVKDMKGNTHPHLANTDRQSGNTYISPYLNFQVVLKAKYECYVQYS